jgi:hypothetical protein
MDMRNKLTDALRAAILLDFQDMTGGMSAKKMEEATCADDFPHWHDATSTGYRLRRLLPSIAWLHFTGSLKFHFIFVIANNDVVH